MYGHLQEAMLSIGFVYDDSVELIMRRFRRLLGRAQMAPHEVKLLRGLARQILWAADRAGLTGRAVQPGPDPTVVDDERD